MSSNKISEVDGRIRGQQIDIEFNDIEDNKPKELKLHHVTTLPQNLQLWCVVVLSIGSILSDIVSVASSLGLINSNSTLRWRPN